MTLGSKCSFCVYINHFMPHFLMRQWGWLSHFLHCKWSVALKYLSSFPCDPFSTPLKMNMEPTDHLFLERKIILLPNLHEDVPCESSGVYPLCWNHVFSAKIHEAWKEYHLSERVDQIFPLKCRSGKVATWGFPKIVVPPKSPILIGFSIINHPYWGTPIFGNTHIVRYTPFQKESSLPTTIFQGTC